MKSIQTKLKKALFGIAIVMTSMGFTPISQAEEVVRFAQPSDGFLYLPVYIARERGYFKEEGITADVSVFKGGAASLTSVISGNSDIYIGVPAIGMKAIEKGQDVTMFASIMNQYGSNVVIQGDVAKRLGLNEKSTMQERLNALKGLTMGITGPGSATDILLRHMAKNSGIDADRDMTLTPLGGSTGLLAAFKQKRIDGFCLSSPTSDTAVQEMDGFTLFDMAKGDYLPLKDFLYITLIAKSSWLEENPETATKVVKAIWKAQDLMVNNPDQARDSVRTFFTKTDPELFNLAWKSSAPAFSKTPFIDRESIDKNFSLTEEMEGKRLDLKPEAVYTNIFVEKAQSSR